MPVWTGKVPITEALRQALGARRAEGMTWDQVAQDLPISGARCRQIVMDDDAYLTDPGVYRALGLEVPRFGAASRLVLIFMPEGLPPSAVAAHLPYLARRVSICQQCGEPFIWRAAPRGGVPWHRRCDACRDASSARGARGDGYVDFQQS